MCDTGQGREQHIGVHLARPAPPRHAAPHLVLPCTAHPVPDSTVQATLEGRIQAVNAGP